MYSSDSPINDEKNDLLGRATFAKNLAQSIVQNRSMDTLSIGLYGKWGSGKTSLINMIVQELSSLPQDTNEVPVIVPFNPWNFSNCDQLLNQFFIRLYNEVSSSTDEKLAKVGKAIEKYSTAIDILNVIPYGQIISAIGKFGVECFSEKLKDSSISENEDITKQKEKVIKALQEQDRKILIIIDDIDRLSNEEIRMIFKLVNSVANFPNVTYLLSFDKEIVAKALAQVQDCDGNNYLEKIIQVPIEIPYIDKERLHQALFSKFDEMIEYFEDITFDQSYWQRIFLGCIDPFVINLRDMNRLYNVVSFKLSSIYKEINFVDLLAISTLEIFCPSTYQWIRNSKETLTELNFNFNRDKSQSEQRIIYGDIIENTLKITNLKNVSTETILFGLSCLFPVFGDLIGKPYETYDEDQLRRDKRIGNPDKFDLYFNLNIDDVVLPREKIDSAIFYMSADELDVFIIDINKDNKTIYFLEELKGAIPQIDSTRVKVISEVLFKVAYSVDGKAGTFLLLSSQSKIQFIVFKLINKIENKDRFSFIKEIVQNAGIESISLFSDFLNDIELSYGRLAAKGKENGEKQLISLNDLAILERMYCEKIRELSTKYNILDIKNARMVVYLMELLDPNFCEEYFNEEYFMNLNIFKLLSLSANKWIGNGIGWEYSENYKKYFTDEKVLTAIDITLEEKTFWELSTEMQNRVAAFYLLRKGRTNHRGQVSQSDVDEILNEWRN